MSIKITAQQVIDAANEKNFKIINKNWRDFQDGQECRCPLNCIIGTEDEWIDNTLDFANALNTSCYWVDGFLHAIDGDKCDNFINDENKTGYLNGVEVYMDLKNKGYLLD